jgi:hypothetical protein
MKVSWARLEIGVSSLTSHLATNDQKLLNLTASCCMSSLLYPIHILSLAASTGGCASCLTRTNRSFGSRPQQALFSGFPLLNCRTTSCTPQSTKQRNFHLITEPDSILSDSSRCLEPSSWRAGGSKGVVTCPPLPHLYCTHQAPQLERTTFTTKSAPSSNQGTFTLYWAQSDSCRNFMTILRVKLAFLTPNFAILNLLAWIFLRILPSQTKYAPSLS